LSFWPRLIEVAGQGTIPELAVALVTSEGGQEPSIKDLYSHFISSMHGTKWTSPNFSEKTARILHSLCSIANGCIEE